MLDFFFCLLRRDEEVRVVLREVADAEQAVELAGFLMAMDEAEFAEAQRQVAVAALLRLVNEHAARAVHRLDGVVFAINLREVHVVLVVCPVAGRLPELTVQNHRRLDLLVAVAAMDFAPVIDELIADNHAVRMEEREARAFFVKAEEVKLLAELAMVALLRFFEHVEVGIEVGLLFKGRAVDALEHLVVFVAAPVSARDAHELQRLDLARRGDVRACAEVRELALRVERNQGVLRQVVDEFDLVGLAKALKELQRFVAGDFLAHERQVLFDDLLHFLFDVGEVAFAELAVHVDVVVEAVVDGRADGELDVLILIKAFQRLREDVRARMAQRPAAVGVFKRQEFDLCVLRQRRREVDRLAVELGSEHLLGEAVAHRFDKVGNGRPFRNFADSAIFQRDVQHEKILPRIASAAQETRYWLKNKQLAPRKGRAAILVVPPCLPFPIAGKKPLTIDNGGSLRPALISRAAVAPDFTPAVPKGWQRSRARPSHHRPLSFGHVPRCHVFVMTCKGKISVDVILFPRNLVEPHRLEKINDVLAAVVMRLAFAILAHEDDRHVREELHELGPRGDEILRIPRDLRPHGDDRERHPLLDDDGPMKRHTLLLPSS